MATTERSDRTAHGYRRFRCWEGGRQFNERTGSALNRRQIHTDIVFLSVLWRLRLKPSLRNSAEILLLRGLVFSHEAVREWESKIAPAHRCPAPASSGQDRPELIRGQDPPEGRRTVPLLVPGHRQ
jgi:Transposase and inactivated derivatives